MLNLNEMLFVFMLPVICLITTSLIIAATEHFNGTIL